MPNGSVQVIFVAPPTNSTDTMLSSRGAKENLPTPVGPRVRYQDGWVAACNTTAFTTSHPPCHPQCAAHPGPVQRATVADSLRRWRWQREQRGRCTHCRRRCHCRCSAGAERTRGRRWWWRRRLRHDACQLDVAVPRRAARGARGRGCRHGGLHGMAGTGFRTVPLSIHPPTNIRHVQALQLAKAWQVEADMEVKRQVRPGSAQQYRDRRKWSHPHPHPDK